MLSDLKIQVTTDMLLMDPFITWFSGVTSKTNPISICTHRRTLHRDTSQHDWGSRFYGRWCPRLEQLLPSSVTSASSLSTFERHLTLRRPLLPCGKAIKHPVPDRVKPSFVIFDIRALWRSRLSVRVPGCQKLHTYGNSGCRRVKDVLVYNVVLMALTSALRLFFSLSIEHVVHVSF